MKPRGRRRLRTLRRATVSLLVATVVFELILRALLFGQAAPLEHLGAPLRQAWMYSDWRSEDCYRLEALFDGGREHPFHDPLLGWLKEGLRARPYRLVDESELDERRPVLLYGDSFAACVSEPGTCFEDVLAAAPEGETHFMLNLGVGGYGLGQTYLLLRETIGRYAGRNPVVMVGVLVDDDLDRSLHGVREFTKPRFHCGPGGVVVEPVEHANTLDYVDEHPPEIAS